MASVVTTSGSARVHVRIDGWQAIDKQLSALPLALRGKELQAGIRKAMTKIKRRAEQLAPQPGYPGDKPGKKPLVETIAVVFRSYQVGAVMASYVGPEFPAGAHGHLVEHGTKPHAITRKKSGKTWQHPGSAARPFMTPAAEEVVPQVEKIIADSIDKAIQKATRAN